MRLRNDGWNRVDTRKRALRLQPDGPGGGGIAYLLRDLFTTNVAAGSVNGTAAEPGPGTRTVTDTNSKLAITGGVASFATGGVDYGNPMLQYASHARAFGRTYLGSFVGANTEMFAGWSARTSNFPNADSFYFESALVLKTYAAAGGPAVGTIAASTVYQLAVTLRAAGAYFFIKGGTFTNWTLVWIDATNSATPLYPTATGNGNTVFTADNIRVPIPLYTVPVLAYDTFARANGALGSTETTGPDGQAVTARAWTDRVGTWGVASNVAAASALSGGIAYATAPCASADVVADVAFTRSAGSGGLILRYTDANNYLRATHDGTNCLLEQVVAGTPTTLRTGVATYAAGAVIRVILSGTEGRLFYNGAAVGAVFTVPSSSAADHGLYTTNTGNTLDVFQAMARGTGGEYAGLDAF